MSDFWSRRREAVEAEDRVLSVAEAQQNREEQEAALARRSDEDLLHEFDLPSPEHVDTAELLQRFMRSALPRRLKQQALRQFWTRKPVLACLDGLVDYADDYTDAATCVPDLKTTYQVGKGLLAHVEAAARKAAETEALSPENTVPEAEVPEDQPGLNNAGEQDQETLQPYGADEGAVDIHGEALQCESSVKPARRMRFRFGEAV